MGKQIGFSIDKQGNKRTILCLLGFRKATKYIIKRIDGKDYFVCSRCGKRLFCLLPLNDQSGGHIDKEQTKYCEMENGCLFCDRLFCEGKEGDQDGIGMVFSDQVSCSDQRMRWRNR